jgi:hypothetical protein
LLKVIQALQMQWEKKQKRGTPKGGYFAPEEALSPVFGGHVSRP